MGDWVDGGSHAPFAGRAGPFGCTTDGGHRQSPIGQASGPSRDFELAAGWSETALRQFLRARLIDELHLAVRPILMGAGEHLFADLDLAALGYRCISHDATDLAVRVVLRKEV